MIREKIRNKFTRISLHTRSTAPWEMNTAIPKPEIKKQTSKNIAVVAGSDILR